MKIPEIIEGRFFPEEEIITFIQDFDQIILNS